MLEKLLKRLVSAATVYTISIILVSCGGRVASKQPPEQMLSKDLPSIQVKALYPGANIRTILDTVTPPLKDSIYHYIENMDHLIYTASSDGSLIISVYFKPATDLDQAALKISNVVAVVTRQLPSQVVQSGITVLKQEEPIVMAVDLYSEDAANYAPTFLANYAAVHIVPEVQRIQGVSHLITFDTHRDSLIRIWLNKKNRTATLNELLTAIPAEKVEAVTGIVYKNGKQPFDYMIKCKSEHNQLDAYRNMIIRTNGDTVLRLKDVTATIEFGPPIDGNVTRINGKPGVNIVITPMAGSNYNETQRAVKELMETASMKFPAGLKHRILYNPKDSLYMSIE
ncbi:efflux RND transporter permease subunit [Chitinophaga sp.]|uniref:efflux RND transporter permease subunit n=1 Tax=Chitinophaga sp. TaxID=1869181 RepID=UPI002F91F176